MPYMFSFERIARKDGRKEGLREGRREGQSLLLTHLLRKRFGALPTQVQERLAHATTRELLAWSEAFADAATLDEVFQPGAR